MNALTTGGGGGMGLMPSNMDQAMRLAEMMARGKMIPEHLRNPADALMVIEQAMRWQMSPFAVAQCTSVIQGKLMFEGKLVAAAINSSGILETRLREEFSGAGPSRAVTLRGTIRGETAPREITVTLAEAKTSNSMWTKQPDQQLIYFGTRAWARRHCPEVMLGVYSPEEFDDAVQPTSRSDSFQGPTIDGRAEITSFHDVPMHEKYPSLYLAPIGSARDAPHWMRNLTVALTDAKSVASIDEIEALSPVQESMASAPPAVKRQIGAMFSGARARVAAAPSNEAFVTALNAELNAPMTPDEIDAVLARDDVQKAQDTFKGVDKAALEKVIGAAVARAQAMETSAPNNQEE